MTRAQLFPLRFAATASVLVLAFVMIRLLWFPAGYFQISGMTKLVLILVIVNLIIGPGLSTLVYKPGKKGMTFDLIVLACIEIGILAWAMHAMLERRPAFAVFAVDRFKAVAMSEVDLSQLLNRQLANRPGHTPRLIYAELPTDVDAMNLLIDETVFLGMPDIDRRPKFWTHYAEGIPVLKTAAKPLSELAAADDARAQRVRRWLARQALSAEDYLYLPIRGRVKDGMIILHADIAYPVDVLAIDPW